MRRAEIPISTLPAWTKLNDVLFYDISVENLGSKGYGFVVSGAASLEATSDTAALLKVPKDLILCAEAVQEHARVDKDFRELLKAAGGVSTRGDIMLFLLMQMTMTSPDVSESVGVSNSWTEYVRMLPSEVPVPTTWQEEQRVLLLGTSLELALSAKVAALEKEFERLRECTNGISWCQNIWWERGVFTSRDWVCLDSWYRSRCLELPDSGDCMVPVLDMANHASDANAYYEKSSNGDIILLLKPDEEVVTGKEITISYGVSKSAAEMLFSYGFIDEDVQTQGVVLGLQPIPDDPLGKAKLAVFSGPPIVRILLEADVVTWSSPFLLLMCLNEEDGLEFRVLQEVNGSQRPLQVFWQNYEVTMSTGQFEEHVSLHPMRDVFILRAVTLLQQRLKEQLERLFAGAEISAAMESSMTGLEKSLWTAASKLRVLETALLEEACDTLESQKSFLMHSPVVLAYLGTTSRTVDNEDSDEDKTNDDDFS